MGELTTTVVCRAAGTTVVALGWRTSEASATITVITRTRKTIKRFIAKTPRSRARFPSLIEAKTQAGQLSVSDIGSYFVSFAII